MQKVQDSASSSDGVRRAGSPAPEEEVPEAKRARPDLDGDVVIPDFVQDAHFPVIPGPSAVGPARPDDSDTYWIDLARKINKNNLISSM